MSEQAEEFLAQWQIEHIKVVARSDREHQALRLALRCREDAARGFQHQIWEAAALKPLVFSDGPLTQQQRFFCNRMAKRRGCEFIN